MFKVTTKKTLELLSVNVIRVSLQLSLLLFLKSATEPVFYAFSINGSEKVCNGVCF